MTKYVVRNTDQDGLFWSNVDGWVGISCAEVFDAEDVHAMNPPIGGVFVSLWEVETLQFARLIAEIEAEGLFMDSEVQNIADRMDLARSDIWYLIERAKVVFDGFNANMAKQRKACQHVPDWDSVTIDSDGGERYVDIVCAKCGASGCLGTVKQLASTQVDWD